MGHIQYALMRASGFACTPQGNTVELPEEENTPEKRVDRIFALMDKVEKHKHGRDT